MRYILGLAPNVFFLGLVSFFTDISSEMIFPLLPLFLVGPLGASKTFLGVIEGLAESGASLLKLASGWLSDRLPRRKPLVVLGYTLSAVTKPLFAFVTTGGQLLGVRLADRSGKGIRGAPRDALIAESIDENQRGRAFGFHRTMDNAGELLGPTLASLLLILGLGFRDIFLLSAIPGAIALLLLFALVREPARPRRPTRETLPPGPTAEAGPAEQDEETGSAKNTVTIPLHGRELSGFDPRFRLLMLSVGLLSLATFSKAILFPVASERGIAIELIPLLYLVTPIVSTLGAYPAGALSDRFGRRALLAAGGAAFVAMCLVWMADGGVLVIGPAFALLGLHFALTEGVQRAFVVDLAGDERRGTALGIYYLVVGIAALPASVIAGALFQNFGADSMFAFSAIVAGLATLLLLRV